MDIEKFIQFGIDHMSEYFLAAIAILRKPTIQFPPLMIVEENQPSAFVVSKHHVTSPSERLNPKLLVFVFLSILIGLLINTLVPNWSVSHEFFSLFVFIVIFWFFYGCVVHWLCRFLGGKGSFVQTTTSSLQVLGIIYVVSNLITLLVGIILTVPQVSSFLSSNLIGAYVLRKPMSVFITIQFFLLSLYLPRALKYVHQFGWKSQGTVIGSILLGMAIWILVVVPFTLVNFVDCFAGQICGGGGG